MLGPPSYLPEWLSDALSTMFLTLIIASLGLLIILQYHQNSAKNPGIVPWLTLIVNKMYAILISFAVLAFIAGAWLSPAETEITSQQKLDHKAIVKAPKPIGINKDVGTSQVKVERVPRVLPKNNVKTTEAPTPTPHRIFTPRTPKELIEIAVKNTRRDAMKHKGTWIRVQGPVFDIHEAARDYFDDIGGFYIKVEVAIESPPHFIIPKRVMMFFKADLWEKQVEKIERGDWLVATGIVHDIYKMNMEVINGEIVSVSGPGKRKK